MYVHILFFCLLMFSGYSTLTGRKFALVEGLSHDLVCAGSNYHVHFGTVNIHPVLNLIN